MKVRRSWLRMLSLNVIALSLGIGVWTTGAQAEVRQFELGPGASIEMDVPHGWLAARDYLGTPLMMLGPETTSQEVGRPVISITPTRKAVASLRDVPLERDYQAYRAGRDEWLRAHGGQLVEFKPLRRESWAAAPGSAATSAPLEIATMGYRYRVGAREFDEASYYLICRGALYHVKSLTRASQGRAIASQVARSVRSFTCK